MVWGYVGVSERVSVIVIVIVIVIVTVMYGWILLMPAC